MDFYDNQFFHIYNQGNNRKKIFYNSENYHFFLLKAGAYISPFAKIIAYCLMPNHFHLLVFVESTIVSKSFFRDITDNYFEQYNRRNMKSLKGYKSQISDSKSGDISLNQAIGILQRSYTRALNLEYNWSGSIFRQNCKAKDGWKSKFVTTNNGYYFNGNSYVAKCMCYLHENPAKSNLVSNPTDWEFSSARDYAGLREKSICHRGIGYRILGQY